MKFFSIKLWICVILILGVVNSDDPKQEADPINDFQEGPVKFEINGDTSHLFADEDFEKKEAVLLKESVVDKETKDEIKEKNAEPLKSLREAYINLTKNSTDNKVNVKCTVSSLSFNRTHNSVQLVNGSALTKHLSNSGDTECFVVLFYVPWCPFSVRLAPIYNSLPRAFLTLDVLAFDVSKSVGYNTKFGTSAVPMIIIFQHKNILAKYNYTNKNLTDYIEFIANHTSLEPNRSISIESSDLEGPVPTVVLQTFDYYLLFSWILVIFVSCDLILRKTRLKTFLIQLYKYLFTNTRPRQLPQGPLRRMIQNNEEHLHND